MNKQSKATAERKEWEPVTEATLEAIACRTPCRLPGWCGDRCILNDILGEVKTARTETLPLTNEVIELLREALDFAQAHHFLCSWQNRVAAYLTSSAPSARESKS